MLNSILIAPFLSFFLKKACKSTLFSSTTSYMLLLSTTKLIVLLRSISGFLPLKAATIILAPFFSEVSIFFASSFQQSKNVSSENSSLRVEVNSSCFFSSSFLLNVAVVKALIDRPPVGCIGFEVLVVTGSFTASNSAVAFSRFSTLSSLATLGSLVPVVFSLLSVVAGFM